MPQYREGCNCNYCLKFLAILTFSVDGIFADLMQGAKIAAFTHNSTDLHPHDVIQPSTVMQEII